MKISDLILEFANKLGKCKLIKQIFRPVFNWYKRNTVGREKAREKACFDKYGLEILKDFDVCLTDAGYKYVVAFGTLLGVVREHDFIAHDDDIDTAMWIGDYDENLISVLENKGFKLKYSCSIDGDKFGKLLTFIKRGVMVDIFFFYQFDSCISYFCDFVTPEGCPTRRKCISMYGGLIPRKITVPLDKSVVRVNFKGLNVPIPEDYDAFLKARYGDDYMTPLKKSEYKPNPNVQIWGGKVGTYKEY